MNNPWKQNYDLYTRAYHKVWRTLFDRQMECLPAVASQLYLDGLSLIRFSNRRVPDFEKTNKILKKLTGWQLQEVPGILPVKEFFQLLQQKKFCATTWLRRIDQLDYLEQPDMFHDVFGHVPMLTQPQYCAFFHGLSRLSQRYSDPRSLEWLNRIYWFTIEFGMVREFGEKKIYGSGILSSHGETVHCMEPDLKLIPFDVAEIFDSPFRMDTFQDRYFVLQSFDQLYLALEEIDFQLAKRAEQSRRHVA